MNAANNTNGNKAKITIIIPCNTHWVPFLNKYLSWLAEINVSYNIIFWNREGIEERFSRPSFAFDMKDTTNNNSSLKFYKFFAFSSYIKKILRTHGGKKLIFMGTYAAIPALLYRYLKRHYKNAYWIDIRDSTYERFSIYKRMLGTAINYSYATAISSRGFLSFLPQAEYLYIHNINLADLSRANTEKNFSPRKEQPVRISFIGNVRYYKQNERLLRLLGNDPRFILQYFGSGSEYLVEYCEQNGIKNVRFMGKFSYEQTGELYENTDVINNVYGNQTTEVQTALSNKLYYSAIYGKPILVSKNTYMEKVADEYGMGLSVDTEDVALGDKLYDWYMDFDFNASRYKEFIESVIRDEGITHSAFNTFVNDNETT